MVCVLHIAVYVNPLLKLLKCFSAELLALKSLSAEVLALKNFSAELQKFACCVSSFSTV